MHDRWYRNAVIYALDVECFMDSNGDGVGDFRGLMSRLDYLVELGVTCLWLLPFYPTPNRDDGYDVADYYDVDPRLGDLDDFRAFMQAASERGLRVIVELVVNHTSIDHPWFQAARSDPDGPFRDYYIWVDGPPAVERRGGLVFPGEQHSNWEYDEVAGASYWHWFYAHQPDLNTGNPAVREEIKKIMAFWLDLGVSGFRVDAAPFLFKRKGVEGSYPEDPHAFLLELRAFLSDQQPDAIFLAEADVSTEEITFFLGEEERMHLILNFILNNYFFLALARGEAEPIREAYGMLPVTPQLSQWAVFVRNHDELNLDRLPPAAREEVFEAFAPDAGMRIYNRGIRRRLPPMLEGDRRRIEMASAAALSLPGTPIVRYGEEIGMGDDLALPGRLSVRTPMQWSAEANAGFSTAPSERLVRPVVEGDFGPERVNVADQWEDPESLLAFFRRAIRCRRLVPEFGTGRVSFPDSGSPGVLIHRCDQPGRAAIAVHNFSAAPQRVRLPLHEALPDSVEELLADQSYHPAGPDCDFEIAPYGYRWMRIRTAT